MKIELSAWEGEGGTALAAPGLCPISLTDTANQVEWAERIKRQVDSEFDRVSASLRLVAEKQNDVKRADTETIIAILEDKRIQVMGRRQAGYFIRDWQEISDQVRELIRNDARYQAIKARIHAKVSRLDN